VPKPYDATTKFLVEGFPADWLRFAGLGPIGRVDVIDANLSTITAEADKVLRVDGPEPWLAHVELQTSHEGHLPRRLLRYNTLLDDRHDLPTRSIVVLLRPQADGNDLSGVYRRTLPGDHQFLEFRYDVIRAWEQPVEQVLAGGLGTLPMAPVSDLAEMEPAEVIRRMKERVERELETDPGLFWSATGILMGLRFPDEETMNLLRGVRGMKESSFYQMILREGRAEGVAEGIAEGVAQGMAQGVVEGQVEEARRILLRQGQRRFGPVDQMTATMIASTDSIDRIEGWLDRVLEVSSWEELLAETPSGE
jgi:predicted transposase YdaD